MGLFGALYTGVAGLNAQSQAQSAISENVSNVNTVGYKKVETNFSTLVVESTPRSYSPGGPFTSTNHRISEQGALQGTTSNTDIGISGNGFIVVNEAAVRGTTDEFFYTRAGKFTPDRDGYLRNTAGFYLQGWALDSLGNKPTNSTSLISLTTVNVGNIPGTSIATTKADVEIQIPAKSPIDAAGDPADGFPVGSQQSSDIVVYDSLGIAQSVRLIWTHVGTNAWNLTINPGSYGNPPAPNKVTNVLDNNGTPLATANKLGTPLVSGDQYLKVTFNNDGTLKDITNNSTGNSVYNNGDGTVKIRFDFSASGANPQQDISFNFGPKNPTVPGILKGLTQKDADYSVVKLTQDGVPYGTYKGVTINEKGIVSGQFTNGLSQPLYQLPLATFANPNGLTPETGNVYSQTREAGDLILRDAASGGSGKVLGATLENSTVDIGTEFAKMIITQRAYNANTRVVSTSRDMLSELDRLVQ